jgi:adenine-specific DNA methylase
MERVKSVKTVVNNIKKRKWAYDKYAIQSWGSWIHKISPYVGRINPSFAHFLIKHTSYIGDLILDPFGGIGTIPAEAILIGRDSISNDLNPYATIIAKSKAEPKKKLQEHIDYFIGGDLDERINASK